MLPVKQAMFSLHVNKSEGGVAIVIPGNNEPDNSQANGSYLQETVDDV